MKFTKAKKKFLKKRVAYWHLQNNSYFELTIFNNGRDRFRYCSDTEVYFQIFSQIRKLGFVKGFFKAREIAKKYEFEFWYEKKIQI